MLLLIDILVAIATAKIPMLLIHGLWAAAHESRTDYCMLRGSIFLLIVGGGTWSLDAWWRGRVALSLPGLPATRRRSHP